jgi:hypothetical protein
MPNASTSHAFHIQLCFRIVIGQRLFFQALGLRCFGFQPTLLLFRIFLFLFVLLSPLLLILLAFGSFGCNRSINKKVQERSTNRAASWPEDLPFALPK